MRFWPKSRIRKALAILLCGCALSGVLGMGLFFAQGRYCATQIGAVGHPYFRFVDGKMYSVVCGKRSLEATYRHTADGWEAISVGRNGGTNASPLDLRWSGVVMEGIYFPRCSHFWMNSHGPLWNPWDK